MNAAQLRRDACRFVSTGRHNPVGEAGEGTLIERFQQYRTALREALLAEVQRRERGHTAPQPGAALDPASFAWERLAPMVNGLFPAVERPIILRLLAESVVFLTPEATHRVLTRADLDTAWKAANVYLRSLGAPPLGGEEIDAVGFSENMVCCVSLEYFTRQERFADWVVHEAAHVFHDQKRRYLGLRYTRYRERLREIDFCKRETFAYACEFYSHIVRKARGRREREALLGEWRKRGPWGSRQEVDWAELQSIVADAVAARNGWKRILARCAPPPRRPMREVLQQIREGVRREPRGST
jgi:hypothetical protein